MKLKLGKMTSKELAQWFGISYNTYKNRTSKYLEILSLYCQYEKQFGAVLITQIYIEEYDKHLNIKDRQLYLHEIEECVRDNDGLSTISGMLRKLEQEGKGFNNTNTGRRRLGKVAKELFGDSKELISCGEMGSRESLWAIRLNLYNKHRLLTEEESELFNQIISNYYATNPEKIKQAQLLEESLRNKEIDSDKYFILKDSLQLNNFKECIFQFQEATGYLIVMAQKHTIFESYDFSGDK